MQYIASRLTAAGRIEIGTERLPDVVPPGHVRLALATASLCGTDLHYYRHFANAGFQLRNPVTLGHEACATVLYPNAQGLRPGQLVALDPIIACGTCPECRAGQRNHCSAKRFPGSATTVPHIDGFFREMFDFPATACHPVPDGVSPDHLTFVEPLACAMHGVAQLGPVAGRSVLVTGCGPMGLLTVVAAREAGAEVEATDVAPAAVEAALQVGASRGHVIGRDDLAGLSQRFDAVVEASGSPHAFNEALGSGRRRGRVVILSNIQPSATPIDLHRIMLKEIAVVGSFQFKDEFAKAIRLVSTAGETFERLVAARFPVSRTGEALALMAAGGVPGKILIKPERAFRG